MARWGNIKYLNRLFLLILVGCFIGTTHAARARFSWARYEHKPDTWYCSEEGKQVAENILSHQDQYGSWPKNIDTAAEWSFEDQTESDYINGTFDNGATTGEMRFLARAYNATREVRYKTAFIKALALILKAQYPTGGWPQCYPPGKGYARYVTFNDNAMVNLMKLLKDITKDEEYNFVSDKDRQAAAQAFERGVDCILKCQICVNGKLKIWCAQHDPADYSPRPARSYELVSLSGMESADVLKLLMSLDDPTPRIIEAITAGVNWYKENKVEGIKTEWADGKFTVAKDPAAPPVWGRFCEIETDRPFFCDRDGIPKYNFNEIDQERSTGYAWYGNWGEDVFKDYKEWSRRWEHLLLPEGTKILAIIGDSTVCNWPEDDVRRGWGQFIQDYLIDSMRVFNKARSGRSTKTFIQQGLWQEVLEMKPDYVLIQFGHNDSHDPGKRESTDANGNYEDYLRQYIDQSREIGAVPVLVTPMYRRKFDEQGHIHDNLLPYANAMKAVSQEKNVPLVDLNSASEQLYLQLGPEGVLKLANASDDQTHFNEKGARQMAQLVIKDLPRVEPSLERYILRK